MADTLEETWIEALDSLDIDLTKTEAVLPFLRSVLYLGASVANHMIRRGLTEQLERELLAMMLSMKEGRVEK